MFIFILCLYLQIILQQIVWFDGQVWKTMSWIDHEGQQPSSLHLYTRRLEYLKEQVKVVEEHLYWFMDVAA
jgi:hypothetical protein